MMLKKFIFRGSYKTPARRKIDDFGGFLSESASFACRFVRRRREHTPASRRAAAVARDIKRAILRPFEFCNCLFILVILVSAAEGIETFSEYWQRYKWNMWEKGDFSVSTYADLKSRSHLRGLHSFLISEQLQYKVSDTLALEFHYTYIHERSLVSNSLWRWQQRLELEMNKSFSFSCNRPLSKLALFDKISNFCADFLKNFESMYVYMVEKFYEKDAKKGNFSNQMEFRKRSNNQMVTRNRLEIRRIEKNPKTLYRFRQRTGFVVPIENGGPLKAYSLHNEVFYDLSSGRLTQDRFSPCTLTFNFSKVDFDLFFLMRYFLHEETWYRSLVIGSQVKF